jgi:1-acyl-sn-glycerol-3-phosphate acyltransferase
MWASGHIIVNRSRHEAAVSELKKAAAKIKKGTPILVFPEGTRSPDHRLGPFKKGGFMLALEAQVPIVPVSIMGTRPMMPKAHYTFKKSDVTIVIGAPLPTEGLGPDDRDRLMELTRRALVANFREGTPEQKANLGLPNCNDDYN